MCGIAGFSVASDVDVEVDATALVRALIGGLAERGEDSCGYAWRVPGHAVDTFKRALPPHEFLARDSAAIPATALDAIVHVRDYTKGLPAHHGNNHPIRHGHITGIHNGIIQNDDELFAALGAERSIRGMTVDSEAIFMALDVLPSADEAFRSLVGSYATAYYDDRDTDNLYVVRGRARPLVIGEADGLVMFASTKRALQFAADAVGFGEIACRDVRCGRMLVLSRGAIVEERKVHVRRFREDRTVTYSDSHPNAHLARSLIVQSLLPEARGA
jgi:glucosamine 6-phosphate synthetase-like amidotransferase/phosphosugar isomerase protein